MCACMRLLAFKVFSHTVVHRRDDGGEGGHRGEVGGLAFVVIELASIHWQPVWRPARRRVAAQWCVGAGAIQPSARRVGRRVRHLARTNRP